jgi:hypothetical protein
VIDLVGAANLVVQNDPDSLPTFETANGRSWIDVTFSRDATVEHWEVREEETLSDHRGISFSIITEEERTDREIDRKRFLMTSQADWKLFRETLVAGREEIQEKETAEGAAAKLQELAMRACNSSMARKARKTRKNKVWWNASLGRLRKESRQARREAQREQDQERKTTLLREYRRKKAAYGKAIKEAKISSLQLDTRTGGRGELRNSRAKPCSRKDHTRRSPRGNGRDHSRSEFLDGCVSGRQGDFVCRTATRCIWQSYTRWGSQLNLLQVNEEKTSTS